MAYTTPRTWTAGENVTAAQLNEQIKDNVTYLKTETDKLDDATIHSGTANCVSPATARAIDTVYQNTSGKIRFVNVLVNANSGESVYAYCDSGTAPSTEVSFLYNNGATQTSAGVSFIVPPNNYYEISTNGGSPSIGNWIETDLH